MAHPDYVNIEHQVNDKSVQYGVPSSYVNVGCQVVPSDYQNLVQKDGFERKSEYTDLTGNTPAVNTTIEDKSVTNSLLPQRRFNYTDILLVSKKPSDLDNDGHDQIFETDIQDALPPVVKPKPKSRAGASPDKMDFTWMRKYKVVLYYSLLSVSIIISIIAATFALIAFVRLQQDCEEFSSYCTINETRGFCLTQPVENITTSSFKGTFGDAYCLYSSTDSNVGVSAQLQEIDGFHYCRCHLMPPPTGGDITPTTVNCILSITNNCK